MLDMTTLALIPKCKKPLGILDESSLGSIHSASLQVLRDVGVMIEDERILELFAKESCQVDRLKRNVRIKESLIETCLKTVPRSLSLYSRGFDEMRVGGGFVYFVSAIDNSHILDSETHQRRAGRLSDIIDGAKLMDELAFHHICCPVVVAHDIAPRLRIVMATSEVMRNTKKHCVVCPTTGSEARYFMRMGAAFAGSEEALSDKPIISTTIASTSPLSFPRNTCDVIWEFARKRMPFVAIHAPIAGATSPVTMAGTMALANAESLAEITISQLINPGTPVVYGGAVTPFDMRYGWPGYGAIEYGMFSIATAQMARLYHMPSYGAGGATNANLSDAQSGYEKMASSMLAYLAGHDMMCDASLNANGLTSLDSIVIQDEILGMLARLGVGLQVSDDTMAFETIKAVGPGGDFLGAKHTRDHFRTDFSYSDISSRTSYDAWLSRGGMALDLFALNKAKQLIRDHEPSMTTPEETQQLEFIIEEARKEFTGAAT
jgi:trimethylamine--corrinoid protein Co-methyltransferase